MIKRQNCRGISYRTQELFLIVFSVRYLDILVFPQRLWNVLPITHCVDTSLFYCWNVSAHPIRVCQLVSPPEQFHASARGFRISTAAEDSAKNK
jgi:hypothetical protein